MSNVKEKTAVEKIEDLLGIDLAAEAWSRAQNKKFFSGTRVVFPTFKISDFVPIDLSQIMERPFDIIERHNELTKT